MKLRKSSLIAAARPGFHKVDLMAEPAVTLRLSMMQADVDRLFEEIIAECRGCGIPFARMANSAFRKRDSGEELSAIERKTVSLFDKIEALEILREIKS